MNASQVIRKEYGNAKNLMTPNVISRKWAVPHMVAAEIACGRSLFGKPIFRVSLVLCMNGMTKRMHELSGAFDSREKAIRYVDAIRADKRGFAGAVAISIGLKWLLFWGFDETAR